MKNRVQFKNLVVPADDLPKINQIIRLLSELAPSDAFISFELAQDDDGFSGKVQLHSPSENFMEEANNANLLLLMKVLSDLSMVHIHEWRKNRFAEDNEKLIS